MRKLFCRHPEMNFISREDFKRDVYRFDKESQSFVLSHVAEDGCNVAEQCIRCGKIKHSHYTQWKS